MTFCYAGAPPTGAEQLIELGAVEKILEMCGLALLRRHRPGSLTAQGQ